MADSLKSKTLSALAWSFIESVGVRGAQFFIGIILARLLSPSHFGLIGMLTIFMAVSESLLDSGFQAALIQKADATQTDISSIFYFNIVLGLSVAGLLCLIAPWIAAFYNQPILTPLMRALSITIIINSFGLIQNTILIKQINFKTTTKVNMIAGILSGIVGIFLAVRGLGVWSLVAQQISRALFATSFIWFFSNWRPNLIFSFKSLQEMFGFGSRILAAGLINRTFDNIYLLVIGKIFSPIDLGYFTRAKTMQEFPTQTLSGMVGRVTFPVFSTIQDDKARLKRGMKKALTFLSLVNFPIMIGLAVIARPLMLTLLTDKWAGCINYLRLLCMVGLLSTIILINSNLLFALGRSKLHLRVEIIKKIIIVINIAITLRWGISAMISGMIVISIFFLYLNGYYSEILIGYSVREQLHDLFPNLIVAILMGFALYAVGLLSFPNPLAMLIVQICFGILVYIGLCRLFRLAAFMEVWQVGYDKMSSFRTRIAGQE